MKSTQCKIEIEEDDDDFLSQVAEAEAIALSDFRSNKRRRDIYSPDAHNAKAVKIEEKEGAYMAALRGTKSLVWQQQQSHLLKTTNSTKSFANPPNGSVANFVVSDPLIPDKSCPCGLGTCAVFTANTERNQGRKFYRCPVRQENGGCSFFEWCDNASSCAFPALPCPCGAGSCLVLTAKTGKNVGQQFYKCPLVQGSSCGYFKWCNDNAVTANASKVFNSTVDLTNKIYIAKTGSSCFNYNNEGHWSKDCPSASLPNSTSPADFGGRFASPGTCYKCNKSGHWANVCPNAALSNSTSADYERTASAGTCYKCNKPGHWAKDCPNTALSNSTSADYGRTASAGTCYKCNKPGHWAKDCPSASLVSSASPADFGERTVSSGTCYKCNKPGHWARNCTFT